MSEKQPDFSYQKSLYFSLKMTSFANSEFQILLMKSCAFFFQILTYMRKSWKIGDMPEYQRQVKCGIIFKESK